MFWNSQSFSIDSCFQKQTRLQRHDQLYTQTMSVLSLWPKNLLNLHSVSHFSFFLHPFSLLPFFWWGVGHPKKLYSTYATYQIPPAPLPNNKWTVCGFYLLFFSDNQRRNRDEEHQHGIFFDDDYDYLQHLKPRTNLSLEPLPDNVTVIETKRPADQFKVLMTHYCFKVVLKCVSFLVLWTCVITKWCNTKDCKDSLNNTHSKTQKWTNNCFHNTKKNILKC